jgi:hypothetical protein
MSSSFRFKASRSSLSAVELAGLLRISPHSISDIQRRASSEESLLDIPVFSGEWPESKPKVVELLQSIEGGSLPLVVYSVEAMGGSPEIEEHLSVEQARQRLQDLREIWLQQDRRAQLNAGHISSPGEYKPPPENEA